MFPAQSPKLNIVKTPMNKINYYFKTKDLIFKMNKLRVNSHNQIMNLHSKV